MPRPRPTIALVACLALLALIALSEPASATHVRPAGGFPLSVPLVPAFNFCTTGANDTHGAPLAYPSCTPPRQSSLYLTVGTPDANGAPANSTGAVRMDVLTGDIRFRVSASDVRCSPAEAPPVCTGLNTADGPDYAGRLQLLFNFRLTDHDSGPGRTLPATVVDLPMPVDVPCSNTSSTSEGGLCTVDTTANAVIPGMVVDAKRAVWEVGQVALTDGGADGNPRTSDGEGPLFRQGVFVP